MKRAIAAALRLDPSPRSHAIRGALLLALRVAILVLLVRDAHQAEHIGRWSIRDGDSWEYLDPAESLLAGGDYVPDHRMPGYSVVWLSLRSFLDHDTAADAMVVAHLLLGTLAILALSWTLYQATASRRIFWAGLLLLGVATYFSKYDELVINESFTTSALMLHFALFLKWRRDRRWRWLILSGALLGWAVFMRPIYAPLLAVVPVFVLLDRQHAFGRRMALCTAFVAPFLLADIPWTVRNYRVEHAFHPLTNGIYGKPFMESPYYAAIKMLQSYGGNYNFWDPTSDIRWFGFRERPRAGIAALQNDYPPPPAYALIPRYTLDSLASFGELLMRAKDDERPTVEQDSAAAAAHRWADRYRAAYAEARPFQYQVMARLRMLRHITVHSGTASLLSTPWATTPLPKKVFKLAQSALYWCTIGLGPLMALLLLFRRGTRMEWRVLAVLVLYGVLAHPFLMRICDMRYLAPTFPLTLIAAVLLLGSITKRGISLRWASAGPPGSGAR